MNRGLFKIENHVLVLDKEYLRGIPEFKVILERQYKIDGDADGRKKRYNYQLLHYVYMVGDMFSYPNKEGLGEKEVHLAACKESKLPLDFKPDDEVKEAIAKYREIQIKTIPALATLNTIIRGLKTADTLSRRIILNIESKLELLEAKKIQMEKDGQTVNIAEEQLIIEGAVQQLNTIIKLANNIPDTIENLEKIESKIQKESSGDIFARGGKKLPNRAE